MRACIFQTSVAQEVLSESRAQLLASSGHEVAQEARRSRSARSFFPVQMRKDKGSQFCFLQKCTDKAATRH